MSSIRYTLLSDGSSDRILMRPIEWLLREQVSAEIAIQPGAWADLRRLHPAPSSLAERIDKAIELYPCDLLLIHRDAENQAPESRFNEISVACEGVPLPERNIVPIVPVRMQEAWLLFNETAVREAAGNPRGRMSLNLPSLAEVEQRADPKEILHKAIRIASGATGRKLRKLHLPTAAFRVADWISDYSPLRQLPAFQRFETDLVAALDRNGWR